MTDVFVGDNDHGDTPLPPLSDLLWAEVTKLRQDKVRLEEDIVHLAHELDTAQAQTSRILAEINCRIEHGADSNGHLEGVYGLFRDDKGEADANNTLFRTTNGE